MLSSTEEAELVGLLEADAGRNGSRVGSGRSFRTAAATARPPTPNISNFLLGGRAFRERLFIAANRIGKTAPPATNSPCISPASTRTGGRAGASTIPFGPGPLAPSSKKVKEILQEELFGPVGAWARA